MKRTGMRLLGVVLLGVLCVEGVFAQATAQISGTVRDQSGAVLPGVEITATQSETGISRSTVSNETGSYVLPNLAVGPYRLEASLPGFRTFVLPVVNENRDGGIFRIRNRRESFAVR